MRRHPGPAAPKAPATAESTFDAVLTLGPLVGPDRWRRLAPYLVVAAFSVVSLTVESADHIAFIAAFAGGAVAAGVLAVGLPWGRLPRRAQGLLILLPILLVEVGIRDGRGLETNVLPVILVALAWLALYETRRYFVIGLVLASAIVGAEIVQLPPLDEVLRGLGVMSIAVVLLPSLRRLVRANHRALLASVELAERDVLTGLANRRGLERLVDRRNHIYPEGISTIFIDIDDFKTLNDTYGHQVGDQLLVEVGNRMRSVTREEDVTARIGGDEFVIVCAGDRADGAALTNRIHDHISGHPFRVGGIDISVTASVGFSHRPANDAALADLLSDADRAMYCAKVARQPARSSPAA